MEDEMENQKISVIIPVYNTKEYLEDCVNSVLEQTWTKIEVILIDDGSKDGSKELCEELCRRDNRIRLFPQEHKGVSAARNAGIEAAEGEYLFFRMTSSTLSRVPLSTEADLFKTLETVAFETPASLAISVIVTFAIPYYLLPTMLFLL